MSSSPPLLPEEYAGNTAEEYAGNLRRLACPTCLIASSLKLGATPVLTSCVRIRRGRGGPISKP
eukprot:6035419-Pyramimonas_sp.AAC.1